MRKQHDSYALTCWCEITRHALSEDLARPLGDDEWARFQTVLYEDDMLNWWGVPHAKMTDQRMFRLVATG